MYKCIKGHEFDTPPCLVLRYTDGDEEIPDVCPVCIREFFGTMGVEQEDQEVYGKLLSHLRTDGAVLYKTWRPPIEVRAIVNGNDYVVPNTGNMASSRVAICSADYIYIAWGNPIKINKYDPSMNFISQDIVGDEDSRLHDFIKLDNGNLILCWHQFDSDTSQGIEVGFGVYDGEWREFRQLIPDLPRPFGNVSMNSMALAQNDHVWCFFERDGHGHLYAIKMSPDGEILEIFNPLIDHKDDLAPDGENPEIKAVPVDDGILVAYQRNRDRLQYAESSVWTYIQIVKVFEDGSYEDYGESLDRTERVTNFALGKDWLAYGRWNGITDNTALFNELVLDDEESSLLGNLKYGTVMPIGMGHCNHPVIVSTPQWIAAQMSDNYIRFFNI